MTKKIPIDTRLLSVNILRKVDGMRRDKKHCDFLIKVGSEEIPAHRNILSANSDYFDAMFSHPTTENESGVVEMMGVDPECAVICIDHMYGKEVFILPEMYEPLMYVATLMLLHELRDAIIALLEANLDPKLYFAASRIAGMYDCKELEDKCNAFEKENFGMIVKEEAFGEMDKKFIKKMMKSKDAKISEEGKLDALLRWIKYDPERNKLLERLMGIVDLSKVSVGFRRNVAENEPLISENLRLYKMVSTSLFNTMKIVTKSIRGERDAIALFDDNSGHIYHWTPRENTWKRMQEMNDEMKSCYFSAVELGGYLYVLMASKSFYRLRYSDEAAQWERMPDMLKLHGSCPPATVLYGYIYVIGGYIDCITDSVEKYNPVENTWISISGEQWHKMVYMHAEVIATQGFIHSFGGGVEGRYVKRHERFDPIAETWTEMIPMEEGRGNTAASTLGAKIYLLGGFTEAATHFRTAEVFDPEVNQWTTLNPMVAARSWFRAFGIDGYIYAVGGYYSSPNSIEMYDVEKNVWKMVELPSGIQLKIVESAKIKLSY